MTGLRRFDVKAPPFETDLARLASLTAGVPRETGSAWSAADLRALCQSEGSVVFTDPEICRGYLLWRILVGEAEILDLGVLTSARRQGLASEMMAAAELAAETAGAGRMLLEVDAGNHGALALYRSRGYAEMGRRPGYYLLRDGGRRDALLLVREF
ncbi:MAG: GNAT family N-acetyltransferase [Pseudomonadota bacterium]